MFWTFKLSFDADILAILGLATVLATFSTIWAFFPNLLVTLVNHHFFQLYVFFRALLAHDHWWKQRLVTAEHCRDVQLEYPGALLPSVHFAPSRQRTFWNSGRRGAHFLWGLWARE
jgi:hypothetical protein